MSTRKRDIKSLIENNDLDKLKHLKEENPNIFNEITFGKYKLTPLMLASKRNRYDIIKFLIDNGADINKRDRTKKSALHHACSGGVDIEIVKLLLSTKNINVTFRDKKLRTALHCCCIDGNLEAVKLFKEYNFLDKLINGQDITGSTPLHLSIRFHNYDIEAFLLEQKSINVNLVDIRGRTALHFACYEAEKDSIERLVKAGVDVNIVDEQGNSALHYACDKCGPEVIMILAKAGADLNIKNFDGETPLHRCIEANNETAAHTLVTSGADVSARYDIKFLERKKDILKKRMRKALFSLSETSDIDDDSSFDESSSYYHGDDKITYKVDQFGFIVNDKDEAEQKSKVNGKYSISKESKREKKWIKLFHKWDKYKDDREKITKLVYKGIPNRIRPQAWRYISNIKELQKEYDYTYSELLERKPDPKIVYQIDLDINRSSRDHIMFKERYGQGQVSLFNILRAYSVHAPNLGYCQSMSDIGAFILKYIEEEEAFWILVKIIEDEKFQFYGRYIEGFPLLKRTFYVHNRLLEKTLPKLAAHLNKNDIAPELYCLRMYMKPFIDAFPFDMVLRAYDVFLWDGSDVLYSLYITLLSYYEKTLLKLKGDELLLSFSNIINDLPEGITVNQWINDSKELRFKPKLIRQLEEEYNRMNNFALDDIKSTQPKKKKVYKIEVS